MGTEVAPAARRRFGRRALRLVRRAHLYLGLFLVPWAVLYGVTGFLFNHPNAFPDQQVTTFDADGTRLADLPKPADTAAQVVAALNAGSQRRFEVVRPEEARFTREFAFAQAAGGGKQHSVLVEVADGSGVVRSKAADPPPPPAAPFARKGLTVPDPMHDRVQEAVPGVLARNGLEATEVRVTSVPDVAFLLRDPDGTVWRATYNPQTGALAGVEGEGPTAGELTARRFLLRLHLAHGYPASGGARWWWAVVVDVMSGVLVFWAASGLVMWWQIRAARVLGAVVIVLSLAAAVWLGLGMHETLTR